ncbi:hypothetical protein [Staphylothermus hellenicus]|uniref:Nucleic acid binding OB-fold tRNA/helicase-type n=1 Tax=Staphylothermus hellenicus (strain DSM 12710 / JCM 10830 / BK20S6-10-b1 / P8) TaxID=591019 RepID=D7D9F9_STAHD|nr:hypothetical protein [Staphylothermus hellenicus]ADI32405.1 hypothetical protein Shell_1312 [Staphylothermus hellenicus DSM 12710]
MSSKKVLFEGVIVGFESPPGYSDPALFIQGSINNETASFYLLIPREKHNEYMRLGVGQMISGRGVIVSTEPLIIKLIGDEE